MEQGTDILEKPKVHHGRNVKRARNLSCKTQEELAELLGSNQKAVYHLEQQEVIEEPTLVHIANVLHFPVEFFKQVQPDDMISKYTFENITITNTVGDSSPDTQNYSNLTNVDINNKYQYTVDPKYAKLCDKLVSYISDDLKQSKAINKKLAAELAGLKKELEKYKKEEK